MTKLAAADLLDLWERGAQASAGERGLLLLEAAEPRLAAEALSGWSVGRRDAALMTLRERAFGSRLSGMTTCPECEASLELELALSDISVSGAPEEEPRPLTVTRDRYRVTFRLPSAGDLAALGRGDGGEGPERWLLDSCIVEAREADVACGPDDLPDAVVETIAATMASADPQAEVELSLTCPECGAAWRAPFDIVSFLWREIEARAPRVLEEVGRLASEFGWSEREILALSPWRRRHYLELVGE